MNARQSADRYQSWPSRALIALRYFILGYILLVVSVLGYAWLQRSSSLALAVLLVLAPLGLLSTLIYRLSKRSIVKAKTLRLAAVLDEAADALEQLPRRIAKYDAGLDSNTAFVWHDVLSPFTVSVTRLLSKAKEMIISEEFGRVKDWTTDVSSTCPPAIVARQTHLVADAIRENDPVSAFEVIGELLSMPLISGGQQPESGEEFDSDEFIRLCRNIAKYLRKRQFLDADLEIQSLIGALQEKAREHTPALKWQALIIYWLSIRSAIMKTDEQPGPTRVWAGPSKVLAAQLDAVLDAYQTEDYTGLSEIIYESFDWRTHIPRFIL